MSRFNLFILLAVASSGCVALPSACSESRDAGAGATPDGTAGARGGTGGTDGASTSDSSGDSGEASDATAASDGDGANQLDAAADADASSNADAAVDADASKDADASPSVCQGLDATACNASSPPCIPTSGKHLPSGASGYAGCATYYELVDGSWEEIYTWPAAFVCAIDLKGDCWRFPSGPVPDGWKLDFSCKAAVCASDAL